MLQCYVWAGSCSTANDYILVNNLDFNYIINVDAFHLKMFVKYRGIIYQFAKNKYDVNVGDCQKFLADTKDCLQERHGLRVPTFEKNNIYLVQLLELTFDIVTDVTE